MKAPTLCPDENRLSAWALGFCSAEESQELSAHVEDCDACRGVFAALARTNELPVVGPLVSGGLLSAPPALPASRGDVIAGKYEVGEAIGAGGMGVVFRARHLQLNTTVALKFIRPEHASDAGVASRFLREARAASRLRSPHANHVLDLGYLPSGAPYMVMEYLEGETVEARVRRLGPIPEREVAALVCQALDALAEAHALGIVHRDLKPANLFLQSRVDGSQSLSVLDFGVAKSRNPDIEHGLEQTALRTLVGSPAFMAPEQLAHGARVDARVDIWAMGCTIQAMLAGSPPFAGADLVDLTWAIRNQPPRELPRAVSRGMRACVLRCLRRDPAERFQSTSELRHALELLAKEPESGSPRRRGGALAVGAALAVSALSVLALTAWRGSHEAPTAPPTRSPELEVTATPPPTSLPPPPQPIEPKEELSPPSPSPKPSPAPIKRVAASLAPRTARTSRQRPVPAGPDAGDPFEDRF